jgi:hypothetical protein
LKWVTWEHVGVDRMACAWLIRRFIDPAAEFLFVPPNQAQMPRDAEPFDIPGVRLSHRHGGCTFRTMLQEYGLTDRILQRIARMVDEADVVHEAAVEPAAPGLDFICRGIGLISADDQIAVERGALIYDGLYAQLAAEPE